MTNKDKYLIPLGQLPDINIQDDNYLPTLWNMCLGGLEFFINTKKVHIHFVIESFNYNLNKATSLELEWIRRHWIDIKDKVHFYIINNDNIYKVDPEQNNWFH